MCDRDGEIKFLFCVFVCWCVLFCFVYVLHSLIWSLVELRDFLGDGMQGKGDQGKQVAMMLR